MSSIALSAIIHVYRLLLRPVAPFSWSGSSISTLDVSAALRLCVVLRQLREMTHQNHWKKRASNNEEKKEEDIEQMSYVKCIAVTLVVVYGGEAVMNPWLGVPPSFVFSPVVPALYAALTALVETLPSVPALSFKTEFPLSFFDGITRAFLLCQLIPPVVTTHAQPVISTSPWILVLTSLVTANGGFFFVNLFSMLHPTGWALATPAELQAYGWTTVDLWCAPVTTVIYALLTHAQPFWAELHDLLIQFAGSEAQDAEKTSPLHRGEALDAETARAACAIFLTILFTTRTVRNMGGSFMKELRGEKKRVIRSKVDGRRLKTKTQ
ncbi:uncharacterized protein FOMMEDRAFT_119826 [Fomitiporia mediterranea MF3/22]|uniref:uncharacterized protein n=1 Tax=Fomitiporia mediterranea (strain MF3/22) TaxID=694068 RepID=UPI00044086F4|nr:uncharacterized protein FOMMEDRAFT_119826 [Fomitiporia mediterranea MF3/22]EJD06260.1 hypothetical protein FOMMEDRAFT_119826 [Fomitiporia mediterranea MF3/22]